jgi:hypothetical protein
MNDRQPYSVRPYPNGPQPAGRQSVTWLQAVRIYVAGDKKAQAFAAAHAMRLGAFLLRAWPLLFGLLVNIGLVADDATIVGTVDDPALVATMPLTALTFIYMFVRVSWIKFRGIRR